MPTRSHLSGPRCRVWDRSRCGWRGWTVDLGPGLSEMRRRASRARLRARWSGSVCRLLGRCRGSGGDGWLLYWMWGRWENGLTAPVTMMTFGVAMLNERAMLGRLYGLRWMQQFDQELPERASPIVSVMVMLIVVSSTSRIKACQAFLAFPSHLAQDVSFGDLQGPASCVHVHYQPMVLRQA